MKHYDGTSWTEVNDLNTARKGVAMFWNTTAALFSWMVEIHQLNSLHTETWDGTNWTETK